ncbi:CLUMA_CG001073, isoform A [Clunio marinus]|uniref:CLUMA_CG001073, isoform A n=1 Tax=Clunio marinus TaxID=568069 RepID=A0A1J1HGY1_9DIPT|nr:CLUMA_CG001073, isoform A [Clunio marinus]
MFQFKLFLILSAFAISKSISTNSRQSRQTNLLNFGVSAESYRGPSSYTTSSFNNEYSGYGNFVGNPLISTSHSPFVTSNGEHFNPQYVNYPPAVHFENPNDSNNQESYSISSFTPSQPYPQTPTPQQYQQTPTHQQYQQSSTPQHYPQPPTPQHYQTNPSHEFTPHGEATQLNQPITVPAIYKKVPYTVPKNFPNANQYPVLVNLIPVVREIKVPIEKEVPYTVHRHVPVPVEKPVQYQIEKHYPVYVSKPYPVKVPIIKTYVHKAPKKW